MLQFICGMNSINTSVFWIFNNLAGQTAWGDQVIIFFADYLAYFLAAIFIMILLFSKDERSKKMRLGLSAIMATIVGRAGIVEAVRYYYRHPRPFVALTNARRLLFESSYSFPSGHATVFFALSSIMYCWNKTLGVIFFVLSAIMGIARIAAGVHYPLDILGGAILGTLIGFASVALTKNYGKGSKAPTSTASASK